jgi:hypothetical protein
VSITSASWLTTAYNRSAGVRVTPIDRSQGVSYRVDVGTDSLGIDLAPGVYEDAQRYPSPAPGHPALAVSANGRACNRVTGRFQVHELAAQSPRLTAYTVTFEQHCEGRTTTVEDCAHVGP